MSWVEKIEKLTMRGGRLFETQEYCGAKSTKGSFPRRMIIDGQEIFDQGKIANCFNKFFLNIGPKLASMIPESQTKFDHYLNPHQTLMDEANLTDDEIKEALRSLRPNKSMTIFLLVW